ncbi:MAG TPA: hypothetical protein VIF09_14615 [Polyangiaceae bacterium]|jgi:hypothetical protein
MYTPPPATPPKPRSIWIWLGPLLGVLVVGCLFAMVSFVRFCSRASDASGVRAANEVPARVMDGLEHGGVLGPGETVVVYYDATIAGDGSEVAMVTSERLLYRNAGRTTAMKLAEIADVHHHEEPLTGDVIEATSDSGATMKVEIAPMNGGDFFLRSLRTAWKSKRGDAASAP